MIRDWEIWAFSEDKTAKFSHCAVGANYKNGVRLIFSIDRSKNWSMGLANQNWRLTPGTRYNFDIQLDGIQGRHWFGEAVGQTLLRVPLADSASLFEAFSAARLLTVNAANGTYRFSLDNSRIALDAVAACALRHLQAENVNPFGPPSNPFERAPSGPAASDDGAFYSEAAVVMTNTLSAIGVTGYRLLSVEELKKQFKDNHAVWIGAGAAGSLRILPDVTSVSDAAADLLAASSSDCDGRFMSGKNAAGKAIKIMAVCDTKSGKMLNDQYIVSPRPQGGVFIFGVFAIHDDANSANAASKVGDLMLASLEK
jgi:hypothetical protein